MSARWMVALTPLVAMAPVETTEPPAAAATRYRIESVSEQVVDLSGMGQPSQTTKINQLAIISITLSDTVGGKVMHVSIDSIASDAPIADPSLDPSTAKGAWLHGLVDSWNRTKIVATSADSNNAVAQIKNTMSRFLPVQKPGAKEGDSWTDTTQVSTNTPQQALKSTTVTTYTRGGAGPHAGQAAFQIKSTSATDGGGTMENPMAGTMEVALTSTGTEVFYVGSDGRYLGGESKSNGKSMIRIAVSPDPIPVTITAQTTVTILK